MSDFFKSFVRICTNFQPSTVQKFSDLQISFSDDFQKIPVKNHQGKHLAVIIGDPVQDGTFLTGEFILDSDNWNDFEKEIYSLTGRFLVVGSLNDQFRIYLDASGTMPMVYDPERKIVASSAKIILGNDYESYLNLDLLKKTGMPGSGLWFPAGLTAHKGIFRLLPNHYLNLSDWTMHRHWPVKEIDSTSNQSEKIELIVKNVQKTCKAISHKYTPVLSLTAGRDSRMLLACLKKLKEQAVYFTFPKFPSSVDTYIAKQLSKDLKLNHKILKPEHVTPEYQYEWLNWNGHCISGEIWKYQHALQSFDRSHAILPGMAGEVGRAFYWKDSDKETTTFTAENLLERLKLPKIPGFIDAISVYIKNLPDLNFFQLLDIVYIEQRLGCWGTLSIYTGNQYAQHFIPFSGREIFSLMMSLPAGYKKDQQLANDIIKKEWPDLMSYPFNRYEGIHRLKILPEYASKLPGYLQRRMLRFF